MAATLPRPPKLSRNAQSILRPRREPGKAPAAALALAMHAGFFALIVFGVSWQVKVAAPLNAELWSALPALPAKSESEEQKPPPDAPVQAKVPETREPEPIKPPAPSKLDIELQDKKLKEKKRAEERRIEEERQKKIAADKVREQKAREQKLKEEELAKIRKAQDDARAAAEKVKADAAAKEAAAAKARNSAISDYGSKIGQLIKSRANIPESVSGKPVIQIRVRLLTNGTVFDAQVSKASGNRVYDEAVERAINGIKQWPLPDNPELLGGRRELTLNIEYDR